MADLRIVPAKHSHINRIANNMREVDARECAAFGKTPKQALRSAIARSSRAWTAVVDNRPEAMFGVVVESVLTGQGVPWFLGTDEVMRHGRWLLMYGPGIISRLHDSTLRLSNLVSSENRAAIRLLERWGFTVHEETQEIGGEMFRYFEKEAA